MRICTLYTTIALALMTGSAMAQSTYQSTTTTSQPSVVMAPPLGTLSTTTTKHTDDGLGDTSSSKETSYGSLGGAGSESSSTAVTQPVPQTILQTHTVTSTSSQ
jgi:hypothetical protein